MYAASIDSESFWITRSASLKEETGTMQSASRGGFSAAKRASSTVVTECPAALKSATIALSILNPSLKMLTGSGLSAKPPPEAYS